jgi:hypothetical protein
MENQRLQGGSTEIGGNGMPLLAWQKEETVWSVSNRGSVSM